MRSHPTTFGFALALALGAALTGCSTLRAGQADEAGPGKTITAEEIERSGASTAWEAVTRLLPNLSFAEDRYGNPSRLARRGPSSIYLEDAPQVFMDGVRLTDYRALESISARSIASIQLLSGLDGTTYYGTNAGDGVIVIRTHTGGE